MSGERAHPCARCGVLRKGRRTTTVCGDCKYVMTKEEWALWQNVSAAVELSHEKEAA